MDLEEKCKLCGDLADNIGLLRGKLIPLCVECFEEIATGVFSHAPVHFYGGRRDPIVSHDEEYHGKWSDLREHPE